MLIRPGCQCALARWIDHYRQVSNQQKASDADVESQRKLSTILMNLSYAVGAVGIYFGFGAAFSADSKNFGLFVLLAVGGPTAVGFVRHVILWRGDAARLGFSAPDPSWMWEVGFANLAIACAAILSFVLDWGTNAQAAIAIVMGIYMLGAAFVHIMSWRSKPAAERKNPVVHVAVPLVYAAMLLYISFYNLT